MSSITTAFPSGVVQNWCLAPAFGFNATTLIPHCAATNVSAGFQTVCCSGDIIDTTGEAFQLGSFRRSIDLDNILCCLLSGSKAYDSQPGFLAGPATTCASGSPTPIASLAATNTDNVLPYEIDYTDLPTSLFSSSNIVATGTPDCLWLYTASGAVMATVTVSAAQDVAPTPIVTSTGNIINTSSTITASPVTTSHSSTSAFTSASTNSSSSVQTLHWRTGLLWGLLVSCITLI